VTEGFTDVELAELARLFPSGRPTTIAMLIKAGFDETLLPSNAANAREYWLEVNREILNGAVADGRRRVIAAALTWYAHNKVLRAAVGPSGWRVLFVGSSPPGLATIRADRELRRIRQAGGQITVRDCPAATVTDLNLIRTERPDILHIACHGKGPSLVFSDDADGVRAVHAKAIGDTLTVYHRELGVRLRGIVLNACTSGEAAELLRPHADVVIAHRDDLDDEDGIAFAEALYRVLPDASGLAPAARIAAQELVRDQPTRRRLATGLVILGDGA